MPKATKNLIVVMRDCKLFERAIIISKQRIMDSNILRVLTCKKKLMHSHKRALSDYYITCYRGLSYQKGCWSQSLYPYFGNFKVWTFIYIYEGTFPLELDFLKINTRTYFWALKVNISNSEIIVNKC